MTPWLCDCHGTPMLWQIDTRMTRGGRWECREKRREYNAKRISVYGSRFYVPDPEFRKLTKEAINGREKD